MLSPCIVHLQRNAVAAGDVGHIDGLTGAACEIGQADDQRGCWIVHSERRRVVATTVEQIAVDLFEAVAGADEGHGISVVRQNAM